jgi:hypothetical protein
MLLPLDQPTLSARFKAEGYRTGYIGKWHLDTHESNGFVPLERRRGFDYCAAHNLDHKHYGSVYYRDTPDPISVPGFLPGHQTDLAIEFLRQKSERPFFLYVSWVAPQPPLTPPPQFDTYDPARLHLSPNVPDSLEIRHTTVKYLGLCSAGAEPGDVLEVRIQKVRLATPYATNGFSPQRGVLPAADFARGRSRLIPLDLARNVARFADNIEIPLRPFFGSMGVAPAESRGRINSGPPGDHAGNLDNKDLIEGTTLFIPLWVLDTDLDQATAYAVRDAIDFLVTEKKLSQ